MKNMIHRPAKWLALLACCSIVALVFFVAISSASPPAGDAQFGIIADNSNAFLNSNPSIYISSPALMALLDDNGDGTIGDVGDNPSNDPLVIDMRSWTDYQATPGTGMSHGHIPGAINLGMVNPAYTYMDIDKPDSLQFISSELAKHANKTIVLACYSGHTDKLAEMALGSVAQAGYFGSPAPDVTALKWGNLEWNSAAEPNVLAEVTPGTKDIYVHTYGIETKAHALPAPSAYPAVINNTSSTDPAEITRAADDPSLHATVPPFIFPGTGAGQVNDSNIGNYTVVDVRSAADYAAGHITGAVNIPYQQLFAKDGSGDYTNLLSIDRSKPIIVYSNGQQEANATAIGLNALGIRNATTPTISLRYGLASWNNGYGMEFNSATEEHNFPIVTGTAPGGATYSAPPRGNTDYVYYFPWYDASNDGFGAGTWVNIANNGASAATVSIRLGGTYKTDFTLAAGAENNQIWLGYIGGPVEVRCVGCTTSGNHLTVAERALFNGTFNETIAPEHTEGGGASDLGTTYSFPWYDNVSGNMNGDWIVATNADPTNSATVDVYVGGVLKQTLGPIAPYTTNSNPLQISPQLRGGPVRVVSRGGQPIVVSQRVLYGNSFNETFGRKLP